MLQPGEDLGGDPFVPAGADRGGRAGVVGDLGVRDAIDQDPHQFVEDDPVRDPPAVAAQGVRVEDGRDQCLEL